MAGEATTDSLQRFTLLLRFLLPLHIALVIWFGRYQEPSGAPHLQAWADALADLCLLLIDLDHFKRINDQYGHPAGDAILQHVASVLASHVRATDTVARLGEEEFIVLVPHTSVVGALALAQKLRQALHQHVLDWHGTPLQVSASVGVCGPAGQHSTTFDTLHSAADDALYAAKNRGRDRGVLGSAPRSPDAGETWQ